MLDYGWFEFRMRRILAEASVLAGDTVSGGAAWQEVAKSLAHNMRAYADALDEARGGGSLVTFPSPTEIIEEMEDEDSGS